MEKETILAKLKLTISFNEETKKWASQYSENSNVWFLASEGSQFFGEFRGTWDNIFIDNAQEEVRNYFLSLDISENNLPYVKVLESYSGSWIIEAAILMGTTIGSTYAILKGVSELPDIVDGILELKNRIKKRFHKKANEKARDLLIDQSNRLQIKQPPKNIVDTDFTIDARPILSLSPAKMKHHYIHLSVGVSQESITIENLSNDIVKNVRIGLFKSKSKRDQWSYGDSYMGFLDIISPNQTLSKSLEDFQNSHSEKMIIDDLPINIDCWIQDDFGIYIFMFYLEQ